MGLQERARDLGIEMEPRHPQRVVVTGYAVLTGLGDADGTWQGLLDGHSSVISTDSQNDRTRIGAPLVNFDRTQHFNPGVLKRLSEASALSTYLGRQAAISAGFQLKDNQLVGIDRSRASACVGTGIGSAAYMIDVYEALHKPDQAGGVDSLRNSKRVNPFAALYIQMEQINAAMASDLGLAGWPISSVEACATGLSNPVEAHGLILRGAADVAFTGGVEEPLRSHPDVATAIYAAMRALFKRNEDPSGASRPYDRDRDGFVLASGGGVLVFESLEHALRRNAHIYAEVVGGAKSMDAKDPTLLDSVNVGRTIVEAMYNPFDNTWPDFPGVIFAHATSTKAGDAGEADAFRYAFKDALPDIPIAAIKSNLGHLLGGAGAVNLAMAIQALQYGAIPPIRNLDNRDPAFADLNLVTGSPFYKDLQSALVVAFGFGGHNAAMLIKKFAE